MDSHPTQEKNATCISAGSNLVSSGIPSRTQLARLVTKVQHVLGPETANHTLGKRFQSVLETNMCKQSREILAVCFGKGRRLWIPVEPQHIVLLINTE